MKHLFELFGTVAIIAAVFYICFGLFSVLFAASEISIMFHPLKIPTNVLEK